MQLVEQHIITKKHEAFAEIDNLCFLSKNLYNAANYTCRQEFFTGNYVPNYIELYNLHRDIEAYKCLPAKVSQQVLRLLDKNWKSYFHAIAEYRKNPEKFLAPPQIPKYKEKNGKNILIYTDQAVSSRRLKYGKIHLSNTNFEIPTKVKDVDQVRIVPQSNCYVVEVVYTAQSKQKKKISSRIAAIDLGVNNLATLTSNKFSPRIYNGKPLKSINQYFNKEKAKLQSCLQGDQKTSKRIRSLTHKRNNKVKDYLHNTSRKLVNYLVSQKIHTLVIGKNDFWKQNTNLGYKKNNQNFVQIPHAKFIDMLKYKCELEGIKVFIQEESYTSKCSFLDWEPVEYRDTYLGKRIKRGLFQSADKNIINADVNGSLNILRKAFPKAFNKADGIEAFVVSPIRINPYKLKK